MTDMCSAHVINNNNGVSGSSNDGRGGNLKLPPVARSQITTLYAIIVDDTLCTDDFN